MRVVAAVMACLVAAGLSAPAFAQTSYQRLPDKDKNSVTYWNAAGLKRAGANVEIEILEVFKGAPGQPLTGTASRRLLSCMWSATGGLLGLVTLDAGGKVKSRSGPEPFTQMSFYGPHGWQARVAPAACDPATTPPRKGMTAAQAMADAAKQLAGGSSNRAEPTRGAPPPADAAAARFGLVDHDSATGGMSFIDWSRLSRTGDRIKLQVLDILGDDTPPPPEPQWNYPVIALRSLELDCSEQSLVVTGFVSFTKSLEAGFPDGERWPARSAANWPLGAKIVEAACAGAEPDGAFRSRAAAIAYQRSLHPLRKAEG
jgi:hypothetical protein